MVQAVMQSTSRYAMISWRITETGKSLEIRKLLESVEEVRKIEQMPGKSLDFLGFTSGDKQVQKIPIEHRRLVSLFGKVPVYRCGGSAQGLKITEEKVLPLL